MSDLFTLIFVSIVAIEFCIMILYVCLTNYRISKIDRAMLDTGLQTEASISKALENLSRVVTLKTYTAVARINSLDPTTLKNLKSMTVSNTDSYPLYATSTKTGSQIALNEISDGIRNVEFLVLKDTYSSQLLFKAASSGDVQYAVIGGAPFLILQYVGGSQFSLSQSSNFSGEDIVLPLVSMKIDSFTDQAKIKTGYRLQETAFSNNAVSLEKALKPVLPIASKTVMLNILAY